MAATIILEMDDLRQVAAYAATCAAEALDIYEQAYPADYRPREAVEAARAFAEGGRRVKRLRDTAWAALRAARESENEAAGQAARAAMCAASAAYLHPLADPHQVKHILGAAACAVRANELAGGDPGRTHPECLEQAGCLAQPRVTEILGRFPPAPQGGGRTGELIRALDVMLRAAS